MLTRQTDVIMRFRMVVPRFGDKSSSEPQYAAVLENPTMESTIGRRIFIAHLELSYRLGRRVTLAEFGRLVADRLRRGAPFAATAVWKGEGGLQTHDHADTERSGRRRR